MHAGQASILMAYRASVCLVLEFLDALLLNRDGLCGIQDRSMVVT